MNNETLAHHGIKGQRWGVRRFQNADGTLTNAGKKRYSTGSLVGDTKRPKGALSEDWGGKGVPKGALSLISNRKTAGSSYPSFDEMQQTVKQKSMEKAYDKALDRKSKADVANQVKNAADQTKNSINAAKNQYQDAKKDSQPKPDVSKMSNKELQDAITRMNLEDNYIRLVQNREAQQRGKDKVDKMLDTMGTVAQVASTAAAVAAIFLKLKGL